MFSGMDLRISVAEARGGRGGREKAKKEKMCGQLVFQQGQFFEGCTESCEMCRRKLADT